MSEIDIHEKQDLENVEKQWQQFLDENDIDSLEDIDDNYLKEVIESDLSVISKMDVKEYTLYQKWQEVHTKYPTHSVSTLFGEEIQLKNLSQEKLIKDMKDNIWIPESPEDYDKLEPIMINTSAKGLSEKWNTLRTFLSTMKNNSNIGRQIFFIIADNRTGKYLGVICISGDFMDLTPRDQMIGWDRQTKTFSGKINHTAIGSTIVPTQPLGYSYTGGKLLAYLCLSNDVQNLWESNYGDKLVGVTTTSLYGKTKTNGLSQYDGLKYWKRMGFTTGSVSFEPELKTRKLIKQWLKKKHTRKYFEWYEATRPNGQPLKRDHKNRSYMYTYSRLNIPKEYIKTEHNRGIYFTKLYENTPEYLRGEIDESKLIKSFDTSVEALVDVWKKKHASKRIKSLLNNNNFSTDSLFYDDLIYLSWDETKEKYLYQVGR